MQAAANTAFRPKDQSSIVCRAHAKVALPDAVADLRRALGEGPFAIVFLFVSGLVSFADIIAQAQLEFGDTPINACTTAGEIAPQGYAEGSIVAVGLPASHFEVKTIFVEDMTHIDQEELIGCFIRDRHDMAARNPLWPGEFAFAMIDGLSMREEALLRALTPGLGGVPLFGGSAGDGGDGGDGGEFEQTWVAHNGRICENAAVISVVRTRCKVKVFSLDHFSPAGNCMVVTKAEPDSRIVSEINAEPALDEYARAVGLAPEMVNSNTFASNPLLVRVGDTHHVRGILRCGDDGALEFASAIDVGLVLHLTKAGDIENHLKDKLADLATLTPPDIVMVCDCLWRKVEVTDRQAIRSVSKILSDNSVIGFNTLGEQIDSLHVNHTMTGVAIYPPTE
ncbi:MAG: FIST N-terminal domain-containing protein [Sulfitobacter sp.]